MASPFHTTSWSLISRTRESGTVAREAVASLCQQYWQPLYVFVRRDGQNAHAAEDTIQDFFIHFVEQELFTRADSDRGRFRTFLLAALRQFMARQHRDATRLKRAPQSWLGSLDLKSAEQVLSASDHESPEKAYERAWACAQLDLTWKRLEREYVESGKTDLLSHLRPVVSGKSDVPIREIATKLGMTEGAMGVAAHRLRRRFGEALREQIGHTLATPDDVDDEIARLRTALSGAS